MTERTCQVRAGKLCYWCRLNAPTHTDEFGARECDACAVNLQQMRLKYIVQTGYRMRQRGQLN